MKRRNDFKPGSFLYVTIFVSLLLLLDGPWSPVNIALVKSVTLVQVLRFY